MGKELGQNRGPTIGGNNFDSILEGRWG